jgi:O-glycosyl hydrolase
MEISPFMSRQSSVLSGLILAVAAALVSLSLAPGGLGRPASSRAAPWPSSSAPAVGVDPVTDRQYVFWRGADGLIYETYFAGVWHGPIKLGWSAASAPEAAVTSAGDQYVFWRATNGHIDEAWYQAGWHGPTDLTSVHHWGTSGTTAAAIGAAVNPINRHQYLFWRAHDGRIHEAWYSGAWRGPLNLGWRAWSAPAVGVTSAAHQYVFWQGADGHIEEAWFYGGWRGPRDLTTFNGWAEFGESSGAPGVAVNAASDHQYLFWRAPDSRVYEAWYFTSWSGPRNLGWSAASPPSAAVTLKDHQYVFWRGADGALWEGWRFSGWRGPITPFAPGGRTPKVLVTQTTVDLSERMARMSDLPFRSSVAPGIPVISVDDSARFQRISGIGAAMTDTSAWLIWTQLDDVTRLALMNDLFSSYGSHLDFVLVPMGGSDFTMDGRPYTYDDLPAGQVDPQLAHFSIGHDLGYVIPSLRQMLAINPDATIFAAPWTAPPWMKANDAYDNSLGHGALLPSAYQPLASYFVKFLKAYAAQGVPVAAVAPENEPDGQAPFPGMGFPAAAEAQWISRYLKPALEQAGLATKIYGGDTGWGNSSYANTLLSTPARSALTGLAWHCYSGVPTVMSTVHTQAPEDDHLVAECSQGIMPYPVPEVLIGSLRNWSSAVTLWNIALDPSGGPVQPPNYGCRGCTGLVTINENTHTVTFNLSYFQLAQVGAFVRPGAVRVASNTFVSFYKHSSTDYGVTRGLDDAAFVNPDGTRVLVAYNNSARRIRFAVRWRGRTFTYSLPARATVTFTWRP